MVTDRRIRYNWQISKLVFNGIIIFVTVYTDNEDHFPESTAENTGQQRKT